VTDLYCNKYQTEEPPVVTRYGTLFPFVIVTVDPLILYNKCLEHTACKFILLGLHTDIIPTEGEAAHCEGILLI
jgi:hypothetical protein